MTQAALPASPDEGMSLADLDRLRSVLPGCETVMLVDISAGTVLGVSSALVQPQESHDALCSQAREALGTQGAAALASPLGLRVFLRAPGHPEEVLCVVVAPGIDLQVVVGMAADALAGRPL